MGATIHLAVKTVDAGPILKRVKPDLEKGDDYYTINYKTIKKVIDALPQVAVDYVSGKISGEPQVAVPGGYVYKKRNFNEKVLKQALSNIGDGLTVLQVEEIKGSSKCNY